MNRQSGFAGRAGGLRSGRDAPMDDGWRLSAGIERREFVRRTGLATAGLAVAAPALARGAEGDGRSVLPASAGAAAAPAAEAASGIDAAAQELVLEALDAATAAGADYADARVGAYRNQRVGTRERQITNVGEDFSVGFGVRALVDGSWGFAATRELTREAVGRAAQEAVAIGKANAAVQRFRLELAPVESYGEVSWTSAYEVDPWDIPIGDKVEHLLELNGIALEAPNVEFVTSNLRFVKIEETSGTTDGTIAAQTIIRTNPSINITAISSDRTDFQSRSALDPAGRGWEYVLAVMTPENVQRWAQDASEKLTAASVEPGRYDLVIDPTNLWLTIHESIGHPTELDRALGYEANYAGTSFLAPPAEVIGKLRYGPDFMQIRAERTSPGGLCTIGWDEEGVKATEWPLIEDGIFVDYQTTRAQAPWIAELTGNRRSHGCAHCDSWSSIPFQRMPNVNLLPAEEDRSLEDLFAATDRGIYIQTRGSYSIDQQRYNFQFSGQVFREIRGGKPGRMLRDVAYQATTTDFWNAMDLIGGRQTYYVGGSFSDGKGQPGQVNAVSHGCPAARFHQINVLNTARG